MGAPGTTAALALLNDQVKKGGVMASSYVGGLSGAFIPVSYTHLVDGEIMAVEHRTNPVYGLQFHPESILTPEGKKMLENFFSRCV